jgi:hypothetical protein
VQRVGSGAGPEQVGDGDLLRQLRQEQGRCPAPECSGQPHGPLFKGFLTKRFTRRRCGRVRIITDPDTGKERRKRCSTAVVCAEERRQQLFITPR